MDQTDWCSPHDCWNHYFSEMNQKSQRSSKSKALYEYVRNVIKTEYG